MGYSDRAKSDTTRPAVRVEASRELLASRSDVWGFLSQPYHLPDWWPTISSVHPDRRGFAPGARWEVAGSTKPTWFRKASATGVVIVKVVELHERVVWTLSARAAGSRGAATCARARPDARDGRSRRPLAARGVRPAASRREGGRRSSLRARPDGRRTRGAEGGVAMFDLRYHVASLTAVFIALIIGILVGVGISSGGFVKKSERRILNDQIEKVQRELDAARTAERRPREDAARLGDVRRGVVSAADGRAPGQEARRRRLRRRRRCGEARPRRAHARRRRRRESAAAARDAGTRRSDALDKDLPAGRRLARYAKEDAARDLGRRLAQELAKGGKAPVWRALAPELVEERSGNDKQPADAIVIVRSATPQQGDTARLLRGFYEGLASQDVPAVGVETSRTTPTPSTRSTRRIFRASTTSRRAPAASRSRSSSPARRREATG